MTCNSTSSYFWLFHFLLFLIDTVVATSIGHPMLSCFLFQCGANSECEKAKQIQLPATFLIKLAVHILLFVIDQLTVVRSKATYTLYHQLLYYSRCISLSQNDVLIRHSCVASSGSMAVSVYLWIIHKYNPATIATDIQSLWDSCLRVSLLSCSVWVNRLWAMM